MPSKKLTAKKREELKRMKNKGPKSSSFPIFIILAVIIIVGVAGAYFVLSNNGTSEDDQDTNGQITETAPIATEDYSNITKNLGGVQIDVLANDEDDEKEKLTIINVTTPSHGAAEIKDNYIFYVPEFNYTGEDSFNYTISDGNESDTTTVYITVEELNPLAHIATSKGDITIELYKNKAPITCDNFIKLANDGFYDGMNFYRISDNFMIQAGRYLPDGSQKQSPYGTIDFEAHPDVLHVDGAISMARGEDPNSASAEFFICDGAQRGLDDDYLMENYGQRGYTAFGVVIEGFEVLRDIADDPHDNAHPAGGGKPLEDIVINSITIELR